MEGLGEQKRVEIELCQISSMEPSQRTFEPIGRSLREEERDMRPKNG
jgi:hypothetical protein